MSKVSFRKRTPPDTPSTDIVNVYIDTSGNLCWQDDAGKIGKIASAGTYTLTIPATGTAALLGTAQTFSAAQTFSNVLTAPGIKPASDSTTAIQLQNAAGTAIVTTDTTNGSVGINVTPLGKLHISAPDDSVAPAILITQSNDNQFGFGLFLDQGIDGKLYFSRWTSNSRGNDIVSVATDSKITISNLQSYANNAAAVSAGLTAGTLYLETGTNPLRVCCVY